MNTKIGQNTTDLEVLLEQANNLPDANGSGGEPGEDGATFTPHVDEEGTLSWTNDKGLDNPEPVNIKGPQGDKGETPELKISNYSATYDGVIRHGVAIAGPKIIMDDGTQVVNSAIVWDGKDGAAGKTAYQYAKEAGYTGTENDFANRMARSIPDELADLLEDSTHRVVTDVEKAAWNAKSNFSGSYNDLSDKPSIPSTTGLATIAYVDNAVKDKVDKDGNKGLSTNDYTTAEKNKLSNIEAGAQVNVKPNWNATDGDAAEILNKPTLGTMAAKNSVAKTDLVSEVQSSLGKADTALQPGDISDKLQDIVPDYVVTEAETVIDRVITAQGNRTFNLAVLTDFHRGRNHYNDDVLHACQALEYIGKRIKLDAVAILGDYTDLYLDSDYANAIPDYKDVNFLLSSLRFSPNLRQSGNHDFHTIHSPVVHSYVHGFSDGVTWGNKLGGYYHRDFADYKLRVISVNTNEISSGNIACYNAQYQWFADSLDFSEKDDASEWQILILSHHPLDWWESANDGVYRFGHILDAYVNGKSWSGDGISCDYTGKNSARIIGNIHGHLHNLLTGHIHIGNASSSDEIDVVRMCMPEVSAGGGNTYEGVWQEEITYTKIQNTAKDTSMTICCIDLDTYTINAVCYGAGYDRTVVYYDPAKPKYKNMLEYAINSDGTPYRGANGEIGYKTGTRLNSSGAEASNDDYCVTGFIPILNWDYAYLKNMNFIVGDSTVQPNTRVVSYDNQFKMKRNIGTKDILTSGVFGNLLDENGGTVETGDAIGRLRYVEGNETEQLYIRFSTKKIDDTSVVTINEPIVT